MLLISCGLVVLWFCGFGVLGQGVLGFLGAAEGGNVAQMSDFKANIAKKTFKHRILYQFLVVLSADRDQENQK